jgi:phosphatidylinositol alpha-mannosyltransferase
MAAIAPDPSASLRTIRALRDEQFDVVHLHEPIAPGPTLTALVFANGPMIGTFHRAGASGWVRSFRPLVVWALSHLDLRAAVSEEARETAEKAVGGTYEVVWNGIDVDLYQEAEPWPSEGPTVLFIGRHEPRKGLAVLIEAMRHMGPEVTLWVGSQGPETEPLREATRDDPRIQWLGVLSEAEKVRRIRGADVLCAPSLHGESFGVILVEGMAAATPVVASDLAGYRTVATQGEAILVPPGAAEALAAGLGCALRGGEKIDSMVELGLKRASALSMVSLAELYVEMYQRVVRPRPGRLTGNH